MAENRQAAMIGATLSAADRRSAVLLPERATFFHERARYRRAPWRWTIVSLSVVVVMGLPLSLLLTPLLYLAAIGLTRLVAPVVTTPPGIWGSIDWLATLIPHAAEAYQRGPGPFLEFAGQLALVLIVPGGVVMMAVWIAVWRLLVSVGTQATINALRARVPQDDVAEERQFQTMVEEVAAAAGVPVPRVWITEQLAANAALVGHGPADAAIVVSRRMLNTCDAAEQRALAAHLMASLVHWDPGIAARIESVYLSCAALNGLLNAPFGASGRRVLVSLLRGFFLRRRPEAVRAVEALLQEWGSPAHDLTRFLERNPARPPSVIAQLLRLLLVPLYLLNLAVLLVAGLVEAGVIGPILAAIWRARRYLADAGAVELTRNASELARALHNISGTVGDPHWAPARLQTVIASDVQNPARSPGGLTNAHPPIDKRLKRLITQGAILPWQPRAAASRRRLATLEALSVVALLPLMLVVANLMALLIAFVTTLVVSGAAFALTAIHAAFGLLQ